MRDIIFYLCFMCPLLLIVAGLEYLNTNSECRVALETEKLKNLYLEEQIKINNSTRLK